MRILLDTQCWLWMALSPERFSPRGRRLVEDQKNVLYLSAASAWEIAIKHALGKLRLPEPPVLYVPDRVAALGVQPSGDRAPSTRSMSRRCRRIIAILLIACSVAQAQLDDLAILTADPLIAAYDVTTIAA